MTITGIEADTETNSKDSRIRYIGLPAARLVSLFKNIRAALRTHKTQAFYRHHDEARLERAQRDVARFWNGHF